MACILSCFHDETGEQDMRAGYYMVAMVIHDQGESLEPYIRQYEDRLVYCIPYDEEYSADPVPVGIDVSDSILMTEYRIYEHSCVFSIGSNSRNIETCGQFLDWILEGKTGAVDRKILEAETETEAEAGA